MEHSEYIHSFTLYCKGKQADIDRFKTRIAATLSGDGGMGAEDDMSIGNKSITFYRRDYRPDMFVFADFLPRMAEFTEETGAPLSFFFAVDLIERDYDDVCCGYVIFRGGEREAEFYTGWIIYDDLREDIEKWYEEENQDEDEDSYLDGLNEAVAVTRDDQLKDAYDAYVKPVLNMWLDDFSSDTVLAEVTYNPCVLDSMPETLKKRVKQAQRQHRR